MQMWCCLLGHMTRLDNVISNLYCNWNKLWHQFRKYICLHCKPCMSRHLIHQRPKKIYLRGKTGIFHHRMQMLCCLLGHTIRLHTSMSNLLCTASTNRRAQSMRRCSVQLDTRTRSHRDRCRSRSCPCYNTDVSPQYISYSREG